jgi:hypothetical protein
MSDARPAPGAPGVYVFRQVGGDRWQLVGEAARRPGSPVPGQAAQSAQRLVGRVPESGSQAGCGSDRGEA